MTNWAGSMSPDPMKTVQIQTDSEQQTMTLAMSLLHHLRPGDVVALDGPLGSGKTCFVRGLAMGLGIDPAEVSSPTFVIRHEYALPDRPTLTHIDAYRLSGPDELETIGWDELMQSVEGIVAVEWAGRIAPALPARRIDVAFAHLDLTSRDITLSVPPELADRIMHLADEAPARCPSCGVEVIAENETFPFCSPRCRMADLGKWFSGAYRVGRPVEEDDLVE